MNISINDLGNIKTATDIKINKFNIYIGKNGSGKTYFSKLIHYIENVNFILPIFKKNFSEYLFPIFESRQEDFLYLEENINSFIKDTEDELKKNFALKLGMNKEYFKKFSLKINPKEFNYTGYATYEENESFDTFLYIRAYVFMSDCFGVSLSNYFPAARANYMFTYKYLIDSMIENSRMNALNGNFRNTTILPDIETEFIRSISLVDTKRKYQYYKYANLIEKEIFKNGKLSIKNPKTQDRASYEYKLNDTNEVLDLHATSSAVTELSPILMYLRHKVVGSLTRIVIDEPELSLHPDAQNKFVEILVKLYNEGLNITLVTHSPFIIEAVNNHLMRFKIKDKELSKEIESIPKLSPIDTSVYLFEDNTIKNILDEEQQLIDDKLLTSFNNISSLYEKMRDIEFYD